MTSAAVFHLHRYARQLQPLGYGRHILGHEAGRRGRPPERFGSVVVRSAWQLGLLPRRGRRAAGKPVQARRHVRRRERDHPGEHLGPGPVSHGPQGVCGKALLPRLQRRKRRRALGVRWHGGRHGRDPIGRRGRGEVSSRTLHALCRPSRARRQPGIGRRRPLSVRRHGRRHHEAGGGRLLPSVVAYLFDGLAWRQAGVRRTGCVVAGPALGVGRHGHGHARAGGQRPEPRPGFQHRPGRSAVVRVQGRLHGRGCRRQVRRLDHGRHRRRHG